MFTASENGSETQSGDTQPCQEGDEDPLLPPPHHHHTPQHIYTRYVNGVPPCPHPSLATTDLPRDLTRDHGVPLMRPASPSLVSLPPSEAEESDDSGVEAEGNSGNQSNHGNQGNRSNHSKQGNQEKRGELGYASHACSTSRVLPSHDHTSTFPLKVDRSSPVSTPHEAVDGEDGTDTRQGAITDLKQPTSPSSPVTDERAVDPSSDEGIPPSPRLTGDIPLDPSLDRNPYSIEFLEDDVSEMGEFWVPFYTACV